MTDSKDENNKAGAHPPATSLERAEKTPRTGQTGSASRLQPGGTIPGGGPAGGGMDDMGEAKKNG